MKDEFNKIKEDLKEVISERFYSPMYFYFIIAWIVTNWKFVYVLLFANQENVFNEEGISKISLLSQLYSFDSLLNISVSVLHLVIIPATFSFVAVWLLSIWSEKFFKKYETHKQNKRVIQREIEYRERFRFVQAENKIKKIEQEQGKKDIEYTENEDFNNSLDEVEESIEVGGISFKPSEILYNNDYEAYKEALVEWYERKIKDSSLDNNKEIKSE